MPDFNKPDAILVPRPYMPDGRTPHTFFNAKFGPYLGVKSVQVAAMADVYFLKRDAHVGLLFPSGHDHHPRERHDWYVVQESKTSPPLAEPVRVESWREHPDAVKFGYLRDENDVLAPTAAEKESFARATQDFEIEYRAKVQRHAALLVKGPEMDAAERDEFAGLNEWFQNLATNGIPDATKA